MRLSNMFRTVSLAFLLGLLAACGGKEEGGKADSSQTFATSKNDKTFVSPYFGMTMEKPSGWYAMSAEEYAEAMGLGAKLVAGNNAELETILNASEDKSANIFAFYEHEVGAPVAFNSNILAVAENVRFAPGVKTGKDYFVHMKQLAAQSPMAITYRDGAAPRQIGRQSFDRLDGTLTLMGQDITQEYYAARRDQHIIGYVLTYQTAAERDVLYGVLDSIEFSD